MSETKLYIGVDDTDNLESRGTGNLTRRLLKHLGKPSTGVTRHQFLVHPDIPYTSHNSGACIVMDANDEEIETLTLAAQKFVETESAPGSDPGVCVARASQLRGDVLNFAQRAQQVVLEMKEAIDLAMANNISLTMHGGNGQGIIGALSACALRASGEDGRFIELNGLRKMEGAVTVAEMMSQGINYVVCEDSDNRLEGGMIIETNGWVRPQLRNGNIYLTVRRDINKGDGFYEIDRGKGKDKDA